MSEQKWQVEKAMNGWSVRYMGKPNGVAISFLGHTNAMSVKDILNEYEADRTDLATARELVERLRGALKVWGSAGPNISVVQYWDHVGAKALAEATAYLERHD